MGQQRPRSANRGRKPRATASCRLLPLMKIQCGPHALPIATRALSKEKRIIAKGSLFYRGTHASNVTWTLRPTTILIWESAWTLYCVVGQAFRYLLSLIFDLAVVSPVVEDTARVQASQCRLPPGSCLRNMIAGMETLVASVVYNGVLHALSRWFRSTLLISWRQKPATDTGVPGLSTTGGRRIRN